VNWFSHETKKFIGTFFIFNPDTSKTKHTVIKRHSTQIKQTPAVDVSFPSSLALFLFGFVCWLVCGFNWDINERAVENPLQSALETLTDIVGVMAGWFVKCAAPGTRL